MQPLPPPKPPVALPDELRGLMLRVQQGDRVAFAVLVRALEGPGLRLADRTLGGNDRATAEDIVQVALTRLWTMADRFDGERGSVGGWFRRIVFNLCLDRRRARRPMMAIEAAMTLASEDANPEAIAIENDTRRQLDTAMAQLGERQRAAIQLFHGEGLTMAEIAAALETTPKAVEGLLARARMELKALMVAREGEAT